MSLSRFAWVLSLSIPLLAYAQTPPAPSSNHAHDHDAAKESLPPAQKPAPLFDDLGTHHHEITTRSKLAQRYFDQGLTLIYAFNHPEAIRSFEAAAKEDPQCAMAYWGIALASGPNINAPMEDGAVPKAHQAITRARELAANSTEKERAYIAALAPRYQEKPVKDRSALDHAYADAMRKVHQAYPDDLDAATLFAESLMDKMPWDYWTKDQKPKPDTVEILRTLESVLAKNPNHPGAIHYYIHAVEAGPNPDKALLLADRLPDLVPGAGHLVHMPSHIYLRVGLYREATLLNERAAKADESYIAQCNAQGFYPAMYYPHNLHFLWYTTAMEGRSKACIEAAGRILDRKSHGELGEHQRLLPVLVMSLARFGMWDKVLEQPLPPDNQLFELAIFRYARGLAFAGKGQTREAAQELERLTRIAQSDAGKALQTATLPGASVLSVAREALAGVVALRQGNSQEGIDHLRKAVAMEDDLPYMEPPFWYWPVRHVLGAALLQLDRSAEAEAVYREDLRRNPHNGWALLGLAQSLRAQGKTEQAAETQRHFEHAWIRADVTPPWSAYVAVAER